MTPAARMHIARVAPHVAVAAGFAGVTIALTWPLIFQIGSSVPHDVGDPLLSTWTLWWNARVVPFTSEWWHGPFFYPAQNTLTLSDHRVGIGALTTPLIMAGVSPLAAYNLAFLSTFVLSAVAAYALAWTMTSNRIAAVVAGCVFGFNPYRADHLSHLELLASYCLPIVLLALHKWKSTSHTVWLVVLSAALLIQALTGGYFFVFMYVFVALWLLWFRPGATGRSYAPLALALAIPLAAIAPVLWQYRQAHVSMALSRSIVEIESYSADVIGLLTAPRLLALWTTPEAWRRPEGALMPGVVVALLVGGVVLWRLRVGATDTPLLTAWVRRVVAGIGISAASVSMLPFLIGPIAFEVGGMRISVSQFYKPFSIAVVCFVFYFATSGRLAAAARRQSPLAFYALATAAMWILAFGPTVRFLGERIFYKAPYAWLMLLPGFRDEFRVPARFAMLAVLSLSVAAAVATALLLSRVQPRRRLVIGSTLAAAIVLESWISTFPLVRAPDPLIVPSGIPGSAVVLELPLGIAEDALAMFHGTVHNRRVVNGLSGYAPWHYTVLTSSIAEGALEVLRPLARDADLAVFTPKTGEDPRGLTSGVRAIPGARPIAETATHAVTLIPREIPPGSGNGRRTSASRPLPFTARANSGADSMALAHDNDIHTAWISDGPQRGSEEVVAEFTRDTSIDRVALTLGAYVAWYPRELAVDVSTDGSTWSTVLQHNGSVESLRAAVDDPRAVTLTLQFEPQVVRAVRVRQTGTAPQAWAIAELQVFGVSR